MSNYLGESGAKFILNLIKPLEEKLSTIASNANNYVHPTTSGNRHIPSGGANGKILRYSSDGTAAWGEDDWYSVCSTAAATANKTVTASNFKLVTGAHIFVRFSYTNTASSPTLNVNGTGAKSIKYNNNTITAGYLISNKIFEFVYTGSAWEVVGDLSIAISPYTIGAAYRDHNHKFLGYVYSDGSIHGVEVVTNSYGETTALIPCAENSATADDEIKHVSLGAKEYPFDKVYANNVISQNLHNYTKPLFTGQFMSPGAFLMIEIPLDYVGKLDDFTYDESNKVITCSSIMTKRVSEYGSYAILRIVGIETADELLYGSNNFEIFKNAEYDGFVVETIISDISPVYDSCATANNVTNYTAKSVDLVTPKGNVIKVILDNIDYDTSCGTNLNRFRVYISSSKNVNFLEISAVKPEVSWED